MFLETRKAHLSGTNGIIYLTLSDSIRTFVYKVGYTYCHTMLLTFQQPSIPSTMVSFWAICGAWGWECSAILRWFGSFLRDQSQLVLIGRRSAHSHPFVACHVAQYSLHSFSTSTLGEIIRHCRLSYHPNADDTQHLHPWCSKQRCGCPPTVLGGSGDLDGGQQTQLNSSKIPSVTEF